MDPGRARRAREGRPRAWLASGRRTISHASNVTPMRRVLNHPRPLGGNWCSTGWSLSYAGRPRGVMKIDFSSIDAKLRRAQFHREALGRLVESDFREPQRRVRLKATLDQASGFHVFEIAAVPELGDLVEDVCLITADFVHNLRSALDHLAWQLACKMQAGLPSDPDIVYFPVCTGFSRKGRLGHRNPTYIDAADWLRLHELQPCKGLNGRPDSWSGEYIHQLELLDKLWNHDKHRYLPVVLLTSEQFSTVPTRAGNPPWMVQTQHGWEFDRSRVSEHDPLAAQISFEHTSYQIEMGAEVVRIKMTSHLRDQPIIETAGYVSPRVALDGVRPLLSTLDRLNEYVNFLLSEWR
jgi:hypothetical protein